MVIQFSKETFPVLSQKVQMGNITRSITEWTIIIKGNYVLIRLFLSKPRYTRLHRAIALSARPLFTYNIMLRTANANFKDNVHPSHYSTSFPSLST